MVMSDVLTHWSHGRDGSRAGVCPQQPEAGLADLGLAMLPHPSSGSATEALAMCNPTGRATWPAISAQREVGALAELGCGSTASRLQRGCLWWPAAEGGNLTTRALGASVLLRPVAMALLSTCHLAGLWDSAFFLAIYFPWLGICYIWLE